MRGRSGCCIASSGGGLELKWWWTWSDSNTGDVRSGGQVGELGEGVGDIVIIGLRGGRGGIEGRE